MRSRGVEKRTAELLSATTAELEERERERMSRQLRGSGERAIRGERREEEKGEGERGDSPFRRCEKGREEERKRGDDQLQLDPEVCSIRPEFDLPATIDRRKETKRSQRS